MFSDISFNGTTVGIFVLGLVVMTIAIIYIYRAYIKRQTADSLHEKYDDGSITSFLNSRNKYPEADVMHKSRPIFLYGLAAALALTLFAFNWTRYEKEVFIPDGALEWDEEIEVEPPRTAEPPPPPPPPPPPVIEEVPEEEILEEDEPVFEDTEIEADDVMEELPEVEDAPPPPPPPPPHRPSRPAA